VTASKTLFSLDRRVALITGGSRGLGLAMAEGLGQAGATVAINGRNADTLETVASTLRGRGLEAETSPFDVTDHHAAQVAIDAIVARHGQLDILVANAGIIHRAPLDDWTVVDWDRILTTNLKACFFLRTTSRSFHAPERSWTNHFYNVDCERSGTRWNSRLCRLQKRTCWSYTFPCLRAWRVRHNVQRHLPRLFRNGAHRVSFAK
jgi:hypothetical protein